MSAGGAWKLLTEDNSVRSIVSMNHKASLCKINDKKELEDHLMKHHDDNSLYVAYFANFNNKQRTNMCHFCGDKVNLWDNDVFFLRNIKWHFDSCSGSKCKHISTEYNMHFHLRLHYKLSNIPWPCKCKICTSCHSKRADKCLICSVDNYQYRQKVCEIVDDKRTRVDDDWLLNEIVPGINKEKSSDMFAMMVLLSDNFYKFAE